MGATSSCRKCCTCHGCCRTNLVTLATTGCCRSNDGRGSIWSATMGNASCGISSGTVCSIQPRTCISNKLCTLCNNGECQLRDIKRHSMQHTTQDLHLKQALYTLQQWGMPAAGYQAAQYAAYNPGLASQTSSVHSATFAKPIAYGGQPVTPAVSSEMPR